MTASDAFLDGFVLAAAASGAHGDASVHDTLAPELAAQVQAHLARFNGLDRTARAQELARLAARVGRPAAPSSAELAAFTSLSPRIRQLLPAGAPPLVSASPRPVRAGWTATRALRTTLQRAALRAVRSLAHDR